ncbi:hypothetical protein [Sphingomonas sp.]|uniref:hypothetical protein n=1 Tax=Sphingomonas sp. TaxID=28214 RepID=UPI002C4F2D4E|nr:hypothetical protein [Sphingomonas sp.]HTG39830.1 hypothetical protein [Sphingomonas sp.]
MLRFLRAGFVRHFLSGFALGAAALVTVQVTQPPEQPMFPPVADAGSAPEIS